MKVLKVKPKKSAAYEMLREMLMVQKESTIRQLWIAHKWADSIFDWEGLLGAPVEAVDQEFIDAALKPAIEEIKKGFDIQIKNMENLIIKAKEEEENK